MRIAHLTDLHFQVAPKATELTHPKRILGSSNLYLLGRHKKFSIQVQEAAIRAVIDQKPDVVLITGDITAQALPSEFELAYQNLKELLERQPSFIIPGNHDIYTSNQIPRAMRQFFDPWLPKENPYLFDSGDIQALYIETCRVDWLSRGWVDPQSLSRATDLLRKAESKFRFLCIHYPILNRRGEAYGPSQRAISNASILRQWLSEAPIDMVIHGHEHHGYTVPIQTGKGMVPSSNPGSSGYQLDEKRRRRAHYNIYTLEEGKVSTRRFAYHVDVFEPEIGGAYRSKG
ncbi:MAG: metallophosphoesterase [Myxococcota bacterium]|nr:metallophosphoesterase [Myxococcota bacterium]